MRIRLTAAPNRPSGVGPPRNISSTQIHLSNAKDAPIPDDASGSDPFALANQEGHFEPIDDDSPAFGKTYRDLTDDEWSTMHSIATERLYALNWLCGYAANWDDVRCDT